MGNMCKTYTYESNACSIDDGKIFIAGSTTTDSSCIVCESSQYISTNRKCVDKTQKCTKGYGLYKGNSKNKNDWECLKCNSKTAITSAGSRSKYYATTNTIGKFNDLDDSSSPCESHKTFKDLKCAAGYQMVVGDDDSDSKCSACRGNTYSKTDDTICKNIRKCINGKEYESKPPRKVNGLFVSDRTCNLYTYNENNCKTTDRKILLEGSKYGDSSCIQCKFSEYIYNGTCRQYTYDNDNCKRSDGKILVSGTLKSDSGCKEPFVVKSIIQEIKRWLEQNPHLGVEQVNHQLINEGYTTKQIEQIRKAWESIVCESSQYISTNRKCVDKTQKCT